MITYRTIYKYFFKEGDRTIRRRRSSVGSVSSVSSVGSVSFVGADLYDRLKAEVQRRVQEIRTNGDKKVRV